MENLKKNLNNKGITLTVLIITIAILIILLGVSIRVVINANMINFTRTTANDTEISEEIKKIQKAYLNTFSATSSNDLTVDQLSQELSGENVSVSLEEDSNGNSGFLIVFIDTDNYYFLLNGNVTKVNAEDFSV